MLVFRHWYILQDLSFVLFLIICFKFIKYLYIFVALNQKEVIDEDSGEESDKGKF